MLAYVAIIYDVVFGKSGMKTCANAMGKGWPMISLRVCPKITSGFVGRAAWPDARHEGGSVSKAIHDRPSNNADGQAAPRPFGLGLLGSLALLLIPYRPKQVCSSFAPRQKSQLPPVKPELIFAQTLSSKLLLKKF